jgi:hypothetical protein
VFLSCLRRYISASFPPLEAAPSSSRKSLRPVVADVTEEGRVLRGALKSMGVAVSDESRIKEHLDVLVQEGRLNTHT